MLRVKHLHKGFMKNEEKLDRLSKENFVKRSVKYDTACGLGSCKLYIFSKLGRNSGVFAMTVLCLWSLYGPVGAGHLA